MGAYLDKPVTDKVSSDFENERFKCGASSMQGWRVTQEDAHNCILDFDTNASLFAVYDGHGGHEVAEYASQNLPNYIKSLDPYKNGHFEEALKEAFLGFDALLATEPVISKLKEIAEMKNCEEGKEGGNSGEEDVDNEVDLSTLKKEAKIPLTELIARYANSELQKAKKAAKEKDQNSEVTSSSSPSTGSEENIKPNGNCEKPIQNGDVTAEIGCSSSNDEAVTSSSHLNGEVNGDKSHTKDDEEQKQPEDGGGTSVDNSGGGSSAGSAADSNQVASPDERRSKKRAFINIYRSLLDDSYESDSDDNDESFAGADTNMSSDEETANENGNSEAEEEDSGEKAEGEEEEQVEGEEAEGEGEEEEEEEEDEDDEGEDDEEDDDEDIKEFNRKEEPGSDSGCTAVVCLIHNDRIFVANAGDSRAVLCRDGQAIDLSIDHKPDDKAERKRIVAAGGEVTWEGRVNGGLNLSRALGDHLYKKAADLDATQQMITALPDIKLEKIDTLNDEFIILACDGIWNSMSSQEAVDFVRPLINSGEKLSTICEKMFDKCLAPEMHIMLSDGSGSDNMSCIIVQLSKEPKEIATDTTTSTTTKRQSDSPLKEEVETKKVKLDNSVDEQTN